MFCPLDPDLWIRIFLRTRIRIQKSKILRRIRILSTEEAMLLKMYISKTLKRQVYSHFVFLWLIFGDGDEPL